MSALGPPRSHLHSRRAGGGGAPRNLIAAGLAAVLLASCNFPTEETGSPFESTAALETAVAQLLTQAPWATPPQDLTPATPPAGTPPALGPEAPTSTLIATGCFDRALFVADLSIPDETILGSGAPFTKTWRLRNNGTCGWTEEYALVFAGGDGMSGAPSSALGRTVPPGGEIDVSVDLVAPTGTGAYRGVWMLQNPQGRLFGIGPSGSLPFWVQIQVGSTVTPPTGNALVYDFVSHLCEAEWRSGAGLLPCPGTETDPNGFVVIRRAPRFENGTVDDEPAIYTHPQWTPDGTISGRFPAVYVPTESHLLAVIGCAWNAGACEVTFQINYRVGDSPLQNLGQWTETYDGQWRILDIDLSSLAGEWVSFVLAAKADGPATQDQAYWLTPVILH